MNDIANDRFTEKVKAPLKEILHPASYKSLIEPLRLVAQKAGEVVIETWCPVTMAQHYGDMIKALVSGGRIEWSDEFQYEIVPGKRNVKIVFTNEAKDGLR